MNAILIAGAALVGLPILLHLIMKQEPKRLPFPAFRFLKLKLKTNQRKLRLRHFILLALRMLLIALFCLTLYQPTLLSERLNIRGEQPFALVLVIDTSPSMGYISNDKSRLEDAIHRASELLDEMPEGSRVAILQTGDLGGEWSSVSDARRRLNEIKELKGDQALTSTMGTAYQLLMKMDTEMDSADQMTKLVSIFTDRAAACWDTTRVEDLKKLRDSIPDPKPAHTVVDVGVDQPANVGILAAEMKPQVIPANRPATVTVTIGAAGPDVDTVVRCKLDGGSSERKPVQVPGGQSRAVSFEFRNLKPGLHQLEFSLDAADRLMFDNTRYFTFRVAESRKILTIADDPAEARFWQLAVTAKEEFDCEIVKPEQVKADELGKYEVVCLLSVARPNEPTGDTLWDKLQKYVEGGGKLIIIPGDKDRMALDQYDPGMVAAANRLMPGKFKDVIDTKTTQPEPAEAGQPDRRQGVTWNLGDGSDDRILQHPLLAPFRIWQKQPNVDIIRYPRKTWKYWEIEKLEDATTIVSYRDSDDQAKQHPALLERTISEGKDKTGKGKVVLLSTRMDVPSDDKEWHDYWDGQNSWSVVFPELLVTYLAGDSADANFNYLIGQTVTLPLPKPTGKKREALALDGPGIVGKDAIVEPAEKQTELRLGLPKTLLPGNFTLTGTNPDWKEGFSLNIPAEESNLEKVPVEAIEDLTGPNSVLAVGKDLKFHDVLEKKINHPVDLFPWLLIAVLMLLVLEGLVANRFYRPAR